MIEMMQPPNQPPRPFPSPVRITSRCTGTLPVYRGWRWLRPARARHWQARGRAAGQCLFFPFVGCCKLCDAFWSGERVVGCSHHRFAACRRHPWPLQRSNLPPAWLSMHDIWFAPRPAPPQYLLQTDSDPASLHKNAGVDHPSSDSGDHLWLPRM